MRSALAALVVVTALGALGRPAAALSCAADVSDEVRVAASELVFVGTVAGEHTSWWRLLDSSDEYRIRVTGVARGSAPSVVYVVDAGGPCSAPFAPDVGATTGVACARPVHRFRTHACSLVDAAAVTAAATGSSADPDPKAPGASFWLRDAVPIELVSLAVLAIGAMAWRRRRQTAHPH